MIQRLRNSRKTDSPATATSAEFVPHLAPPQVAFALLRNSRITDSPAAAKSAEFLPRLALRPAAYALFRKAACFRVCDDIDSQLMRVAVATAAIVTLVGCTANHSTQESRVATPAAVSAGSVVRNDPAIDA